MEDFLQLGVLHHSPRVGGGEDTHTAQWPEAKMRFALWIGLLLLIPGCGDDAGTGIRLMDTGSPTGGCESDGTECAAEQFCFRTPTPCSGAGRCMPKPNSCPRVMDPKCGCDGVTYESECHANRAGTNVATTGACR
jgi:hypothetical protein